MVLKHTPSAGTGLCGGERRQIAGFDFKRTGGSARGDKGFQVACPRRTVGVVKPGNVRSSLRVSVKTHRDEVMPLRHPDYQG